MILSKDSRLIVKEENSKTKFYVHFSISNDKFPGMLRFHNRDLLGLKPSQLEVYSQKTVEHNKWTHVAFSYSHIRTQVFFFINGQPAGGFNHNQVIDNKSVPWNIGTNVKGEKFKGLIDNVRFYDRALHESEIKKIYNQEKGYIEKIK